MKALIKSLLIIATISIASNAFGSEVMIGKDGVACTVLEDARIHCWNTQDVAEVEQAEEQIALVANEAAEKRNEAIQPAPAKRKLTLIRLAEL